MAYARAIVRFALFASILIGLLVTNAAPIAAQGTELSRVITVAKAQLKDPWKHYAKGPDKFDCVGFVWFAYNQNGLKERIGGYRGVGAYFNWFKERGMVTTDATKARRGDLIVWGTNTHIGIFLGDGMAISALINPYGVSIHPVKGYIGMRVKGYLRVDIQR